MKWFVPIILAACGGHPQPPQRAAETVLIHGDIRTLDPAHPHATAIAWQGGVITAIGGDELARRPRAKVIDLHGHSVTPGLIDAHCHLYELGTDLEGVSLRDQPDAQQAARLLVTAKPADGWIHGGGWDQNKWPGQAFPTKASLDAVIRDQPVALDRVDGHALWVNSKALELAKITAATPDPAGGKIVRDANGAPTGVLIDNAQRLILAVEPSPSAEVREHRILAAAQQAIATGITGIHEMGIDDETAAVYRQLAAARRLPLHVYAFLHGDPSHPEALATRHPEPATGRFVMRGVKFFADGALGSRGARLKRPYDDDPENRGLWVTEPAPLAAAILAAVTGGWDIAVHALGDAAVASVLEAFHAVRAAPGETKVHLRVEHAQIIAPEDVRAMVESGAIASMQPTHATSDMPWAESRIGTPRILGAYAWRTMLDHHVSLIGGSDFPVEKVGPLLGIYAAVTRQDPAGNPVGGWYPAQRITLDEALAAFTRDAAAAEGATDRGVLAVGKSADLTVYAGVLAPDRSLLSLAIAMTIVGGDVAYKGPAQ
ncbi:amidohydrolase [soil metagenome]